MGKFLRMQSVSIFRATAHALHLTGFLGRLLRFISLKNKQCLNQLTHGFHRKQQAKKKNSPRLFCFLCRLLHNTTDRAETVFGHLKHEGALYKGISFASSGSLETGTMHFYASRSNRELISLRDRTRNYK